MATALIERRPAPVFPFERMTGGPAGGFSGDLSCLNAFELLQVFQYLGKRGTLTLRGEGRVARCRVVPGGLIDVECGDLQGWEAALSFVWWKVGAFRFEADQADDGGAAAVVREEPLAVSHLLLEAVQLADEIEARSALVPTRHESLYRSIEQAPPAALLAIRGSAAVLERVERQPGISRRELESDLPFAPVTVGFAVARLIEEGFLGASESIEERKNLGHARPEVHRIVRALLAYDPERSEEVDDWLHRIEEALGASRSSVKVDAAAPSFLRCRLPSGCFLSLTALPISRRNRFVLESLAPSLALAVFHLGGSARDEAERWQSLLPPGTALAVGSAEDAIAEIGAAVRAFERRLDGVEEIAR